jgi:hypothetical protein
MTVDPERLRRVHVAGVRSHKDGFVVVVSDPAVDAGGRDIPSPDTWEVPWERWVAAKANVADL